MAVSDEQKALNKERAAGLVADLTGLSGAEVRTKAMFGGHGIFADDLMFAMVSSHGTAYLRTGDANVDEFEAYGSEAFDGRMPYHTIPPNILGNEGELRAWAAKSLGIARAAKK